ncbi:MAG TPA: hypothetical protein VN371_00100 [Chlorobaculum sp.]|nr:hypothetical protein [Chlorobaculum sp.]
MRFRIFRIVIIATALSMQSFQPEALAWHDNTHLAIAEAAGFDLWYSAAAPDVAKSKSAFNAIESPNHYFNNNDNREVDAAMVMGQVARYDTPGDTEGHLYGAIIGAVREYRVVKASGKFALYPLVYCAHYIGDLSMPLHNTPNDDFNKARHSINDGMIDKIVRNNIDLIQKKMTVIVVNNEADLAREIAVLAESARKLSLTMRKENRDMTPDEAWQQVSRSASLLKAALAYAQRSPSSN